MRNTCFTKLITAMAVVGLGMGLMCPASSFADSVEESKTPLPLLAVIDVVNHCNCKQAFVKSLPDMLITELTQTKAVRMVERTKINSAMKALQLETDGLTESSNLKIGQWVGADAIIVGSFHKLDDRFRLDARVVSAKNGTILAAGGELAEGKDLSGVVNKVSHQLLTGMGLKDYRKAIKVPVQQMPKTREKTGRLRIECKMVTGLFTQHSIPYQKVKVFLNGELIQTSNVLNELNQYFEILDTSLPVGRHILKLEHGKVDKAMRWKEPMPKQPREVDIVVTENQDRTISYKLVAGSVGYRFKDL